MSDSGRTARQEMAVAAAAREYGRAGLFGVLTPQSNPTAEAELRILLPPEMVLLAARLVSTSPSLRRRLIDYGEGLAASLAQFGDIEFDAVGMACTGSSYLLTDAHTGAHTVPIASARGYPLLWAASAIEAALHTLNLRSIALVSPYPAWLTDACRTHWQRRGFDVTATLQLSAGPAAAHRIYALTSDRVLEALTGFDARGAAAIVLAGTGMPSLRVILEAQPLRGPPVLSGNLCLAWALARSRSAALPGPESPLYGGWAERARVA